MASTHVKMPRRIKNNEHIPAGRRPGEGGKKVPKAAYAAMEALSDLGWLNSDIGEAWGISGGWAGKLIREHKKQNNKVIQ